MADWSDWYAKEDPTTWVLAEILKKRASETPDREYLKFADNPWVSYGEVNARANRVANALIARGVQPGESVSVMLPNCEEFLPVWFGILKAGAVMSSINTAYKGDFLSWTINLVEAKKLVISDLYLDRLDLIKDELPLLEHVVVMQTGNQAGPDPGKWKWEPLAELMTASDGEPDGVEYKWTDDARIMFTSGTTGRSKGVIKQNAADYFSARGLLEVVSATAGKSVESLAEDTFFCVPAAVPLQRPGAVRLPGARRRRARRLRRALLLQQVLAAGDRRRGHGLQLDRRGQLLHLEHPRLRPRPRPQGAHVLRGAGAEGHLQRVPGALRGQVHRGLRPHRDRHGHLHGPHQAGRARVDGQGQPRLRGHDRRARHRPAAAARDPRRDRRRHADPEHRDARLLRHAGEDGGGLPQPEAPHRRPGADGRRRLLLLHGPGEGLHPPPRRERLLDGGGAPGRPTTRTSRRRRRSA